MENYGAVWRTILAYAPMSHERKERVVWTLKRSIERVVKGSEAERDVVSQEVVLDCRRRPMRGVLSPFELLYGVKPKTFSFNQAAADRAEVIRCRQMRFLAVVRPKAGRLHE